jgi:hypothetical protein
MPLPEEPVPGWYAVRFNRGGPFVACRIIRGDDGQWALFVGGQLTGKPHQDPWKVHYNMEWVAFSRNKLTEAEYAAMLAAADSAPVDDPLAHPGAAVDLRAAPPLYRKKETNP